MMSTGAFAPLGNDSLSSSWPCTDSTSPRNELPVVRPVLKFSRPSESTSSSATTPIQTLRGRAAIASPSRRPDAASARSTATGRSAG